VEEIKNIMMDNIEKVRVPYVLWATVSALNEVTVPTSEITFDRFGSRGR
jgi:hypothetical protein